MASGPQHRHRNQFGQLITEEEFLAQPTANTEQNPVTEAPGLKVNITTATTTDVKSIGGTLVRVIINGGTAGTVTVYDDTTGGTTTPIAVIAAAAAATPAGSKEYNIHMDNGIQVVTAANTDVTIVYK